jgi:hypothetical protein
MVEDKTTDGVGCLNGLMKIWGVFNLDLDNDSTVRWPYIDWAQRVRWRFLNENNLKLPEHLQSDKVDRNIYILHE